MCPWGVPGALSVCLLGRSRGFARVPVSVHAGLRGQDTGPAASSITDSLSCYKPTLSCVLGLPILERGVV